CGTVPSWDSPPLEGAVVGAVQNGPVQTCVVLGKRRQGRSLHRRVFRWGPANGISERLEGPPFRDSGGGRVRRGWVHRRGASRVTPPFRARSTSATRTPRRNGLERKLNAPSCRARSCTSGRANAVTKITGTLEKHRCTAERRAKPSRSGIFQSTTVPS